jgi:hypothetical protein
LTRSDTGRPCQGKSASVRSYRRCSRSDMRPQPGH